MKVHKQEFIWAEKYRPDTIEDCILPQRLKSIFQGYVNDGKIPSLLLTGTSGVGKTTVALAMCKELDVDYMFFNSSDDRGIDILRTKIKSFASTVSLSGATQKVVILDEADNLTIDMQSALRGVMQDFSHNCTFIMTCNYKSKLIDALHSRSAVIDFKFNPDEMLKLQVQFLNRVIDILNNEQVSFEKEVLANVIKKYYPDYRRTLNELQKFKNAGVINQESLNQLADIRNIVDLYKYLKAKDFVKLRKWVVDNGDVDVSRIYRCIYDSLAPYLTSDSVPQAILIIAKYQYQAAFVADQEVNLVACLTELMIDCQYV